MNHRCGHEIDLTRCTNLGRGQARQRRLADLAGYACPACILAKQQALAARLTRVGGVPYTPEEQATVVERWQRERVPYSLRWQE